MKRSLRSWLWRVPREQEIDEEIALHVEMRTREFMARGLDRWAARALAIERMGDVARVKRTCVDLGRKQDRERRVTQWLDELKDDVRFAWRQLRGAPGFTIVAALTLALGIGANSAIFALVDATLLRPLPYADESRVVMVWETEPAEGVDKMVGTPGNFQDWRAQTRTIDHLGALMESDATLTGRGDARRVDGRRVSASVFTALGVTALIGRTLTAEDEQPDPDRHPEQRRGALINHRQRHERDRERWRIQVQPFVRAPRICLGRPGQVQREPGSDPASGGVICGVVVAEATATHEDDDRHAEQDGRDDRRRERGARDDALAHRAHGG